MLESLSFQTPFDLRRALPVPHPWMVGWGVHLALLLAQGLPKTPVGLGWGIMSVVALLLVAVVAGQSLATATAAAQVTAPVVAALMAALEARDVQTAAHSRYLALCAPFVGRALGMGVQELEELRLGALLHDIGKLGIPEAVLFKPGKLNEEEMGIMHLHPLIGERLLPDLPSFAPIRQIVLAHHERWDGRGYPNGVAGAEIPRAARVVALLDAVNALESWRPYRRAWTRAQVLTYVEAESGKQFDPEVVAAFLRVQDQLPKMGRAARG
ncbi:MAG: HD-GYP domain-containing protein [Ardenticatenales bacterium]|nr:HD-GYP domain-containing protein [Ardenticatenales bacterium]